MKALYFSPDGDPKINFPLIDDVALMMLDLARDKSGIPFIINSHYRTSEKSIAVGGSAKDAHTEIPCSAFDIACSSSRDRFLIIKALLDAGFNRIGVAKGHIHVDKSDALDKNVVWIEQ